MDNWKKYILSIFWVPLLLMQIILVIFKEKINVMGLTYVMFLGCLIWVISLIFGWLAIYTLKKKGGVKKGKSYVHTTKLVTSGLYSIVRHPQYTAGILFSLALLLISQDLWVIIIGIKIMILLLIDIWLTDKFEIDKFGEEYQEYIKEVPRTNFIVGIIRLYRRRKKVFKMKIKLFPRRKFGIWSIILLILFFIFLRIFFIFVEMGERGGDTFFSKLRLTILT